MGSRKGAAGYVKVPLMRSNGRGGKELAHYWLKDRSSRVAPPTAENLKEMVERINSEDEESMTAQSIVQTLVGEPIDWHDPNEGFSGDVLASKYGEHFRNAKIVRVTSEKKDLYCVAAHGEKSLLGALWRTYSSPDFTDGEGPEVWSVEDATTILWEFSDQSKLYRNGVVPIDVTAGNRERVLPSVLINGKALLREGIPALNEGDLTVRRVFTEEELAATLRKWEAGDIDDALTSFVYEYSEYRPRLHRAEFFTDEKSWQDALNNLKSEGTWESTDFVNDFYDSKYHATSAERSHSAGKSRYIVNFEIFGADGVNLDTLRSISTADTEGASASGIFLSPGPQKYDIIGFRSDRNSGKASVYLAPQKNTDPVPTPSEQDE